MKSTLLALLIGLIPYSYAQNKRVQKDFFVADSDKPVTVSVPVGKRISSVLSREDKGYGTYVYPGDQVFIQYQLPHDSTDSQTYEYQFLKRIRVGPGIMLWDFNFVVLRDFSFENSFIYTAVGEDVMDPRYGQEIIVRYRPYSPDFWNKVSNTSNWVHQTNIPVFVKTTDSNKQPQILSIQTRLIPIGEEPEQIKEIVGDGEYVKAPIIKGMKKKQKLEIKLEIKAPEGENVQTKINGQVIADQPGTITYTYISSENDFAKGEKRLNICVDNGDDTFHDIKCDQRFSLRLIFDHSEISSPQIPTLSEGFIQTPNREIPISLTGNNTIFLSPNELNKTSVVLTTPKKKGAGVPLVFSFTEDEKKKAMSDFEKMGSGTRFYEIWNRPNILQAFRGLYLQKYFTKRNEVTLHIVTAIKIEKKDGEEFIPIQTIPITFIKIEETITLDEYEKTVTDSYLLDAQSEQPLVVKELEKLVIVLFANLNKDGLTDEKDIELLEQAIRLKQYFEIELPLNIEGIKDVFYCDLSIYGIPTKFLNSLFSLSTILNEAKPSTKKLMLDLLAEFSRKMQEYQDLRAKIQKRFNSFDDLDLTDDGILDEKDVEWALKEARDAGWIREDDQNAQYVEFIEQAIK